MQNDEGLCDRPGWNNYAHQRTPTACRLSPELADMLSAQKAILDRLVPALRATEMTGKDGSALIPDAPKQSNRQTARALLSLLASGVPTPGQSESEDDEENNERAPTISGTTFTDSDTPGASPLPSEALRTAAGGWAPPVSSDSSNFPAGGKSPPEIGEHKLIGPNGASIQLVKITPDGRERWTVFGGDGADWGGVWGKDAAEAKCEQLVEARKI